MVSECVPTKGPHVHRTVVFSIIRRVRLSSTVLPPYQRLKLLRREGLAALASERNVSMVYGYHILQCTRFAGGAFLF